MTDTQVICAGCGSRWTDAQLADEKARNPSLLSCCPERKPLKIEQWKARAEEAEALVADLLKDKARLERQLFRSKARAKQLAEVLRPFMNRTAGAAEELREENDRLRAALANSKDPCVYCQLPAEKMAECRSGFPGCDRADDMGGCPERGAAFEAHFLREERDELKARAKELAEALVKIEVFAKDEARLEAWRAWRKYIADGARGSWPSDAYESYMDFFAETAKDALRKYEEETK